MLKYIIIKRLKKKLLRVTKVKEKIVEKTLRRKKLIKIKERKTLTLKKALKTQVKNQIEVLNKERLILCL